MVAVRAIGREVLGAGGVIQTDTAVTGVHTVGWDDPYSLHRERGRGVGRCHRLNRGSAVADAAALSPDVHRYNEWAAHAFSAVMPALSLFEVASIHSGMPVRTLDGRSVLGQWNIGSVRKSKASRFMVFSVICETAPPKLLKRPS